MIKNYDKFNTGSGKRQILVADDEMINREILGMVLQEEYDVIFAVDGQETLEKLRENRDTLSLVLMDLKMPVMGGLDVLRHMKDDPDLSRIPVIVLTSDQDAEIESLRLGAIDFIPKPYPQAGVMLARILRTIELSEDRQIISSTERDPLTGLYNREYFYRYAEQFDQRHRDQPMDAIVLDINHFHMINERFGTVYGDGVLRRISSQIRGLLQGRGGIVCRREADTFLIYRPHSEDYSRFLESVSGGVAGDESDNSRIWLRMGVYENADKTLDIERRFDRAKMAADTVRNSYAKAIGVYDNALHEKELFSERLIGDFYTAIEEKQFKVFFQPKFDVRPDIPVLASAEALVRWFHPDLGMISPGDFIPLFEENGLIRKLDHYVWETTAEQISRWKQQFDVTIPVSVNVSRIDMYDPELIDDLQNILNKNGLTPREFLLEITESAYTQDSGKIIDTVNRMRNLGFRIEMDDFGTGYSSLNMISSLPIDALKLDMKFIRTAFAQNGDTRMIEIIIDIADYLSVPVIAEGVETEDQLQALRMMGCDLVQGYYFSRPVPAEEYEKFVIERKKQTEQDGPEDEQTGDVSRELEYSDTLEEIMTALSGGYESIYHVDVMTGRYVEFNANGRSEDLQIEKSGRNFFGEVVKKILRDVCEEDRGRLSRALQKRTLLARVGKKQTFSIIYRQIVEGKPCYYSLKAVRPDEPDSRHIVIGVSNVDSLVTDEEKRAAQTQRDMITYASIAEALAADYFSIFYVNTLTDHFIEYSAGGEFQRLDSEKGNNDFFNLCRANIRRAAHPDDVEMFLHAFTKENILKELEEDRTFTITYRLMFDRVPTYVHLKATRMKDRSDPHIVIGISNVDEQMRREQEYSRAVRAVNVDPLTGVKSKHAYNELEKEVNSRIAEGEAEPFAIVLCDVNGLKQVNDTRGHKAGDKYIRDGCMMICRIFQHSPVYRIGGDEFVAFLRGADYEDRGRLLQSLEEKNSRNFLEDAVTVAAGISEYRPLEDRSFSAVFERADAAMYNNKKKSKEDSRED